MDWGEIVVYASAAVAILMTVVLLFYIIASSVDDTSGTVTDKYYNDPDLVCSKGCIVTSECWTIEVGAEAWYAEHACVSESEYRTIEIGDHFTEN